jgi:predicted DNA-binding transcriptional regulator AlpA
MSEDGRLPKPMAMGSRILRWRFHEIEQHLQNMAEAQQEPTGI